MLGTGDTAVNRHMWYLSDATFRSGDTKPGLGSERGHPREAKVKLTSED